MFNAKGNNTSLTTTSHELATAIFLVNPDAVLTTGGDIKPYVMGDTSFISPVRTLPNTKRVEPLTSDEIKNIVQYRHLNDNIKLNDDTIKDARKLAGGIRTTIGEPVNKQIYWIGPTNDSSEYGATDIAYDNKDGRQPVSLKKGSGQMKNTTINKLHDIMGGCDIPYEGLFSNYIIHEHKGLWNELTREWIGLFIDNMPATRDVLDKFRCIENNIYQRTTLTDRELRDLERAVISEGVPWEITYTKGDKEGRLRAVMKSLCSSTSKKTCPSAIRTFKKQWNIYRKDIFERVYSRYFGSFDDSFRSNIMELFRRQMSAGEMDMWYAAKGGKVVVLVPNKTTFNERIQGLNFAIDSKSNNSGYTLSLSAKEGTHNILTIDIRIRYSYGQMWSYPDVKSVLNDKIDTDRWINIFGS